MEIKHSILDGIPSRYGIASEGESSLTRKSSADT